MSIEPDISITAPLADTVIPVEAKLSGQYFILVGYDTKPAEITRTVITPSKAALIARNKSQKSVKVEEPISEIVSLLNAYRQLSGYSIVGNESAAELEIIHGMKLDIALERESGKSIELVKDAKKHKLYISKSLDISSVNKSIDKYWHAQKNGYAVKNAIFVGMVSMFDELIAKLIRASLRAKPELINSFSLDVPYRDIVAAQDFEALRSKIIDDTVQSLMWKGRSEQLKWIEKNITTKEFSSLIPNYQSFLEVAERRNVFVHNDGIATNEYYDRLKSHGLKIEKREVGSRLRLNQKYFLEAADALIESYIIISQSVVRKITKPSTDEIKDAIDSLFSEASYYQLINDRCESAARIARSVASKEFDVSDLVRKMATVNLAISLKKCDDKDSYLKVIDSADWSSSKDEVKLCIAAIREDMDEVKKLVPKLKVSDWISPSVYFEWPAFEWIRGRQDFWSLLEEVYGEEIKFVVDSVADSRISTKDAN